MLKKQGDEPYPDRKIHAVRWIPAKKRVVPGHYNTSEEVLT